MHRPIFPPELADFLGRRKLEREGVTFVGFSTEPAAGEDRAVRLSHFPHRAIDGSGPRKAARPKGISLLLRRLLGRASYG
jgi:hypothetical protein